MRETKKITEGALLVAIIGVVLVLNRTLGNVLELGFMWILSIPVIIYTAKYGLKYGTMIAFSSFIISFILGSTLSVIFYVAVEMIIALAYGYGVYNNYSNRKLLTITMFLECVVMILSITVFASVLGYNIGSEMDAIKNTLVKINKAFNIRSLIFILFISGPIFIGLCEGCFIHCFTHMLSHKFNIVMEPLKPLSKLNIDQKVAKLSLISIVVYMVMLGANVNDTILYFCSIIVLILFIVVTIKGVAYLTNKAGTNKIKLFIIILTSIIPIVNFIHYWTGLIEIRKGITE